ncbi:MAG: hypothetical protein ACP5JZ_07485, partial [Thermosulfidibacteraceae bacterium]
MHGKGKYLFVNSLEILWKSYHFFEILIVVFRNQVILILWDFSNSLTRQPVGTGKHTGLPTGTKTENENVKLSAYLYQLITILAVKKSIIGSEHHKLIYLLISF